MDDVYQHPVFFECHGLHTVHKRKIEMYFCNRRRSGGGECGSLKTVKENVYSIAFKHRRDQQRVLGRSNHEMADGSLVFTVRDSVDPQTFSTRQEFTDSVKSPQSVPASTPPPSGEEYELRRDAFLLRYLHECPKALTKLHEELTTVFCSAQIYPEEGRVLVRRLAADEGRNWKSEVHKIFDGYQCHYEVDPHKVKALLQSCSSNQTTDEVKVYSEGGMAVVVGECSQVDARLMDVEDSTVKLRWSRLREKQTSIHQLGEAKLHLLWKEIKQKLEQDFPGVNVTQGDAGQLVLEGYAEEVLGALVWVSEKENLVLERTISDHSPHLLSFLRKAYGGCIVLGDILGLSDDVAIELQDKQLRFFTLSADKLDDTQKILQSKFREIKIDVPYCSTVSSELQEMLKSMNNEINQGQCKVQVVFSGSTVYLLGHTKEVEELREIVTQFILDQYNEKNTFHLQEYNKSTQEMALLSLNERNILVASYSLCKGLQVLVCQGDLTKQEADALVNAANEDLDHCGGVAGALSKAGGPEVQKESKALVKLIGKVPIGEVVVTTGGKLSCQKLLHVVGPVGGNSGGREKLLLEKTVKSALDLAEKMEFKSIAMPCIGSGASSVPVTVCAEAIVTAVKEFGSQRGRSLSTIILVDNKGEVVRAMCETCDRVLQGIAFRNNTPRDLEFLMGAAPPDTTQEAAPKASRDDVHVEIVHGTIETQQVDALVCPMVGHNPLSTRVGNTLSGIVGSELTVRFRKEADESMPGDAVLVGSLFGLPSPAVFFLNLIPWDEDSDGTAVQVLRLGINNMLTSCEDRGFCSVALPVLGAGIALCFPTSVVARVLLEEIHAFKQSRANKTPLLVRIAIHPDDSESSEVFQSVQEDLTKTVLKPDHGSATKRIILLGKTGAGKSSLANTIFEEELFSINHTPNSGTKVCQAETRLVNERNITLIDTPGLFDAGRSEQELKPEILSCITECAPGPHAFLIVLKVEKFTEQEKAVIDKICDYFSEDALKYAVIVFTHGDQLPKGTTIEKFISQNKNLSDLVEKCGGRCHVFDNMYWNNNQQNNYRSNQFQVEELLSTIDKMVIENNGGYYTNMMLQVVEEEIKKEEEHIKQLSGNMQLEEIRKQAKTTVSNRFLIELTGTATGVLLGAFFGLAAMVQLVVKALGSAEVMKLMKSFGPVGRTITAGAAGGELVVATGAVVGAGALFMAAAGGVAGGFAGHKAAEKAETVQEATEMAWKTVMEKGKTMGLTMG